MYDCGILRTCMERKQQRQGMRDEQAENTPDKQSTQTLESLVQWEFVEEKKKHSKDKQLLIVLVGAAMALFAAMAKTYIFGVLLILGIVALIRIHKEKPKKMLFNITNIGFFLDDDFVELEYIKGFNVIDDPGKTARLILRVERVVYMNEIIPIYDVNIRDIEQALTHLKIPREEDLEPTVMDHLASVIM